MKAPDCNRIASVAKFVSIVVGAHLVVFQLNHGYAQESAIELATLRSNALQFLAPLPEKMPGAEKDSPSVLALGRTLYFEKQLSRNGSQSCATCHPIGQGQAGVDNQQTSAGALGKRGARNSPTTLNAGFHFAQFWDRRAATLKEQAKGPLFNPVEMAMADESTVVARLRIDEKYLGQFTEAFPGQSDPLTYDNVVGSIAAFERTLVTRDRFDDYLKGDDGALNPSEVKGLKTFLSVGCATCHNGPLLGANSYRRVGIVKPYANQTDFGRGAIVKSDEDVDWNFQFKVPSLRNIAATAPYFHDGRIATLPEAVRTMASIQLGLELAKEQE